MVAFSVIIVLDVPFNDYLMYVISSNFIDWLLSRYLELGWINVVVFFPPESKVVVRLLMNASQEELVAIIDRVCKVHDIKSLKDSDSSK